MPGNWAAWIILRVVSFSQKVEDWSGYDSFKSDYMEGNVWEGERWLDGAREIMTLCMKCNWKWYFEAFTLISSGLLEVGTIGAWPILGHALTDDQWEEVKGKSLCIWPERSEREKSV